MKDIELLAPAKDINKAKIAIHYGADAVYIGGKSFSLRSRASNFGIEEIAEIVKFAHERNKKIYVTCNIVFHDEDYYGFIEYLKKLNELKVDAIIVESLAAIKLAKVYAPFLEVHLSTQINTLNTAAIKMYYKWGIDRVVIAREVDIENMKSIAKNSFLPLEAFIHGGMCSNYSGRCTLSNRMTLRDANRGGCAQSCRWKYDIFENGNLISDQEVKFSMSSKDLRAVDYLEKMYNMGICSLKIEGRMKSDYYIATVVKTYRMMLDEIKEKKHLIKDRLEYFHKELSKAENRLSADGFLGGSCGCDHHLYGINGAGVSHEYVAYVLEENNDYTKIEVRNHFKINDELEVFGPSINNLRFVVKEILDEDNNNIEIANKPMQILNIKIPFKVSKHDMIRKVKDDQD